MPRKTKEITAEQKNIEEKKVSAKPTTKSSTKKASTTKKTKASTSTKKNTTTTKKVAKKSTTSKSINKTKKATSKKTTTKATKTVAKRTSTKATKKESSTTKKSKVDIVEYYDLPYRYNQTVVKVLAQTPNNLFIYWDISDEDKENYKKQYGEKFFENTKPVLIVHNDTLNYSFEIDINDFANSWYLHVNDSKCNYRIELGRRPIINKNITLENNKEISENLKNTDYIYISTSNEIESPNDHILFNKEQHMVYFKDTKTGAITSKDISSNISFIRNMGKIYNIYDLYKAIYNDENIEEIFDLSNPSSGNPTSRF